MKMSRSVGSVGRPSGVSGIASASVHECQLVPGVDSPSWPTTITCSSVSIWSATKIARSASAASTISTLAPESASWWRRYSPLYAVLTGTPTADARFAANSATAASLEFSISVATRSPRCTPNSAKVFASRSAVPNIRAAVHDSPLMSRNSRSGSDASRSSISRATEYSSRSRQIGATTAQNPRKSGSRRSMNDATPSLLSSV